MWPGVVGGQRSSGEEAITARRAARSTKASPLEVTIRASVTVPSRSIWKWTTGLTCTIWAGLNQLRLMIMTIRSM
jgi:hypothetical protein